MALTDERLAEAPAAAAPSDRRRVVLGLALALLTGVLGTLALPPFGVWPLIWGTWIINAFSAWIVPVDRIRRTALSGSDWGAMTAAWVTTGSREQPPRIAAAANAK